MDNQDFLNAIWNGKIDDVKSVVEKGADVNCVDYDTDSHPTALILALQAGRENIAEYLLSKGADPNGKDKNGNTSIFDLRMCKNKEAITKLLIEHGADINAVNNFGTKASIPI